MKVGRIITAAALMLASIGVSSAASAQGRGYEDRGSYSHARDDRGYRGGRRYDDRRHDNRRYYGHRNNGRWNNSRNDRRCWVEWRHHRQVRVCR
jgi:hypothetical protein